MISKFFYGLLFASLNCLIVILRMSHSCRTSLCCISLVLPSLLLSLSIYLLLLTRPRAPFMTFRPFIHDHTPASSMCLMRYDHTHTSGYGIYRSSPVVSSSQKSASTLRSTIIRARSLLAVKDTVHTRTICPTHMYARSRSLFNISIGTFLRRACTIFSWRFGMYVNIVCDVGWRRCIYLWISVESCMLLWRATSKAIADSDQSSSPRLSSESTHDPALVLGSAKAPEAVGYAVHRMYRLNRWIGALVQLEYSNPSSGGVTGRDRPLPISTTTEQHVHENIDPYPSSSVLSSPGFDSLVYCQLRILCTTNFECSL